MDDLLARFEPGQIIGLVAVGGGLLCGMVGIVMGVWLEMRKVATAAALRIDMLNRGLSADEIRTVLDAGSNTPRKEVCGRHACRA